MERYDVYWVQLDPTVGNAICKTRPCVIISPNELNEYLGTVVVAPLTSTIRNYYPYRLKVCIKGKQGHIATDQIMTVDKARLKKKMGKLSSDEAQQLRDILYDMFCVE